MTAPLNPHPHPLIWAILIGMVGFAIAMPFARREDLLGWISFMAIAGFAIFLWATLIVGLSIRLVEWLRNKRGE